MWLFDKILCQSAYDIYGRLNQWITFVYISTVFCCEPDRKLVNAISRLGCWGQCLLRRSARNSSWCLSRQSHSNWNSICETICTCLLFFSSGIRLEPYRPILLKSTEALALAGSSAHSTWTPQSSRIAERSGRRTSHAGSSGTVLFRTTATFSSITPFTYVSFSVLGI